MIHIKWCIVSVVQPYLISNLFNFLFSFLEFLLNSCYSLTSYLYFFIQFKKNAKLIVPKTVYLLETVSKKLKNDRNLWLAHELILLAINVLGCSVVWETHYHNWTIRLSLCKNSVSHHLLSNMFVVVLVLFIVCSSESVKIFDSALSCRKLCKLLYKSKLWHFEDLSWDKFQL